MVMRKHALREYVEQMRKGIGIATHHVDGSPILNTERMTIQVEWLKIGIVKETYEFIS